MIVQTSRAARRLVGRLERGERVHDALVSLANQHSVSAGQVSAVGILEDAQLVMFDLQRRAYGSPRLFKGPLHVLHLNGNLSMAEGSAYPALYCALSRETDNGIEVLGGQLVGARVYSLELCIECWDDLSLERVVDDPTGLALWSRPVGDTGRIGNAPVPQPPRKNPAFAQTAIGTGSAPPPPAYAIPPSDEPVRPPSPRRATMPPPASGAPSVSVPRPSIPPSGLLDPTPGQPVPILTESAYEPQPGDFLEHPSFGMVEVEQESDPGRLRIRLPTGSRREILLDVFEVVPKGSRGDRKVYQLRPRRR